MSSRDGWRRARFGELVANVNEYFDRDGGPESRVVAGQNLSELNLSISTWSLTSDHDFRPTFKRMFRRGDVLFHSRNVEKLGVPGFDGVTGEKIFVLRSKDSQQLLQDFLPWIVLSPRAREYVQRSLAGSVNKFLNWTPLARLEFDLPPIIEQREIADLLWASEDVRERLTYLIGSLKANRRSVFEHETQRGSYDQISVGELLTGITAGRSLSGLGRTARDGEFGVLKVSAVGGDGFAPDENKALLEQAAFQSEYGVRRGDLLMTRANTRELVGRVCIATVDAAHLMLSDKTLRLDVDESRVRPAFLLACLSLQSVRRQIESIATGTGGAMKNISQAKIRKLRVVAPPLDEQNRILRKAAELELVAEQVAQQRRLTQHLRDTLLTRLE